MLAGQKISPRVAAMRTCPKALTALRLPTIPIDGPPTPGIKIEDTARDHRRGKAPIYVKHGASRPYYDTARAGGKRRGNAVVLDGHARRPLSVDPGCLHRACRPCHHPGGYPAGRSRRCRNWAFIARCQLIVSGGIRRVAMAPCAGAHGCGDGHGGTCLPHRARGRRHRCYLRMLGDNDPKWEPNSKNSAPTSGAYDEWHEEP